MSEIRFVDELSKSINKRLSYGKQTNPLIEIKEEISWLSSEELIQFGYYFLENQYNFREMNEELTLKLNNEEILECEDWLIKLIEDSTDTIREY